MLIGSKDGLWVKGIFKLNGGVVEEIITKQTNYNFGRFLNGCVQDCMIRLHD
jgi:hypothetical protein